MAEWNWNHFGKWIFQSNIFIIIWFDRIDRNYLLSLLPLLTQNTAMLLEIQTTVQCIWDLESFHPLIRMHYDSFITIFILKTCLECSLPFSKKQQSQLSANLPAVPSSWVVVKVLKPQKRSRWKGKWWFQMPRRISIELLGRKNYTS